MADLCKSKLINMHFLLEDTPQSETIILTANALLAQCFQQTHALYSHKNNANACNDALPIVLSIQEWAKRLWTAHLMQAMPTTTTPILLEPYQTERVWQKIVQSLSLDTSTTTYQFAYDAWTLCHDNQFDYRANTFKKNIHTQTWQQWAIAFETYCKQHNFLDNNRLLHWLIEEDRLSHLHLPNKIVTYGIDTTLPIYNAFFQKLSHYDCIVQAYSITDKTSSTGIKQALYPDSDTEAYHMAQWAWNRWKRGDQSIGCIIPNLHNQRHYFISLFQTVYHQQYAQTTWEDCPLVLPFEMTQGIHHPIITTALDLLNLTPPFDLKSLSRLLRSPYIKAAEKEWAQRLQLERLLRQKVSGFSSLKALHEWSLQYHCPQFASSLMNGFMPLTDETRTFTQWKDHIHHQLKQWGWPNQSQLSQEEWQHIHQWTLTLEALASLDLVEAPCTYFVAVQQLTHILKTRSYPLQPTLAQTGIYLIDSQDAPYSHCVDALWIMDITHFETTDSIHTNPFIPYNLHKHDVAHSIKPLIKRTPTIVSSTDTVPLSPHNSTLLSDLDCTLETEQMLTDHQQSDSTSSIQWETFEDSTAPPIRTDIAFNNGSDLLYQQANCPFKAFADYRLNLKQNTLTLPQPILTSSERSRLLNNLLSHSWQQLKQQTTLNQLSDAELDHTLHQTVETEVDNIAQKRPDIWQPIFTQLEKERLHTALKNNLVRDKIRPPFEVIANQYEATTTLDKLTLSFKIDRIDRLADGSQLLINYTNRANGPAAASWVDNQKIALQFSLYQLSTHSPVQGISLLSVGTDKPPSFYGMSHYSVDIKGILPINESSLKALPNHNWSTLTQHWDNSLHTLAQAFQAGDATVNPKEGKTTCRYCKHAILCRVAQFDTPASEES